MQLILVDKIEPRLVDVEARPENFRYFLRLAEMAEVDLVNQSAARLTEVKESGNSVYPVIRFDLAISGPYENVLRFIYDLQNARFITRIESLSLTPDTMVGRSDFANANIQIATLGRPPAK